MFDRPNILFISTDHWPASLLGCAGHGTVLTPTLDTLAASGLRFTNAYSECPVCIPARRSLMTGLSPRTHGDRTYRDRLEMPDPAKHPTLAMCFRNAGYQCTAVGKLHVYPQRNRIGFDDVILDEEGRTQFGVVDDYELFLADRGYAGQQFMHGLSNNGYETRPWHLPEELHPTNWATAQMCRTIVRRDPARPGFWYLSYRHPHPPLTPLRDYLAMYDGAEVGGVTTGDWSGNAAKMPWGCAPREYSSAAVRAARKAFYALCTHIDHQLRVVLGTLREQGILDNTIIAFTSDHGDMLGHHRLWAKRLMYEDSANVPMILLGVRGEARTKPGSTDDRLVAWRDIMPTLLDMAGLPIPAGVEGLSMVGNKMRSHLYGECSEGAGATRMIHDGRYKLIYYPTGNRVQLFDLENDPRELNDLAEDAGAAPIRQRLTELLIGELYGGDEAWATAGKLIGLPDRTRGPGDNRALSGQRGTHLPMPPTPGRV